MTGVATKSGADNSRIQSLGSDQVSLLLQTLHLHKELLDACHQDTVRAFMNGTLPCYVVDYEEIYRYMYSGAEDKSERILTDLLYLFSHDDVVFVIGYGTAIEVINGVWKITGGFDITGLPQDKREFDTLIREGSPLARLKFNPEISLRNLIEKTPHEATALWRLHTLLSQKNFFDISEIEQRLGPSVNIIDHEAFNAAWAVMESIRGESRYKYPNIADALNFATVVGLRSIKDNTSFKYFPFLLTNTSSMLDEKHWAKDPVVQYIGGDAKVFRRPVTAVYSHIVSQFEKDPGSASDHTAELVAKIGMIELVLRLSKGYRTTIPELKNSEWEDFINLGQLAPDFERQISTLATFVKDPLITEFQRIYDITRQNTANWKKLQGQPPDDIQTPRKLFDIIIGVSEAVAQSSATAQALDLIWDKVIYTKPQEGKSFITKSYRDISNPEHLSYISIEKHGIKEGQEKYFVLRWPTLLTIEEVLKVFRVAYKRHNVKEVILHIGSSEGVESFDVTFPISVEEIRSEVQHPILWLRMDSNVFDLYADILTDPNITPHVGVLIAKPNRDHLAELYLATSARFIFRSWLMKIFDDAGIPTEESA